MVNRVKVFVSYSWAAEAQAETALIKELEPLCKARDIELIYDQKAMQHGDSIKHFMDQLAGSKYILLILSKRYFESRWCMFELMRAYQNTHYQRFVQAIIVDDCPVCDGDTYHAQVVDDWESQWQQAKQRFPEGGEYRHWDLYQDIAGHSKRLLAYISDMKIAPIEQLKESHFADILNKINHPISNDFLDKITQQITKALEASELAVYRTVLQEELNKVLTALKLNEVDCKSKQIAQGLINALQQGGEECLVINQAFTGAMFRCFDPEEEGSVYDQTQAEHKRLANSIECILGYLVLSLVDPNDAKQLSDWLGHDKLSGMYFELHVRTKGGVELFISHHQQRSPEIDLDDSDSDVTGKHLIFTQTTPFQWKEQAKLQEVQLRIWNAVHTDTRTHFLSADEVSRLRADLKTKSVHRRDPQNYCVVFESDEDMNKPYAEQCAKFLDDLNIPMIRYKVSGEQQAFYGLENTLMSSVTNFLQDFSEYRDQ